MKFFAIAFVSLFLPLSAFSYTGAIYKATSAAPPEFQTLVVDWVSTNIAEEHSRRGTELELGSPNAHIAGQYEVLSVERNWKIEADIFIGEKVLVSKWDAGCGEGYEVKARVVAKQPYLTAPMQNDLKITLTVSETNDTCHSNPSVQHIEYKLIQKAQ